MMANDITPPTPFRSAAIRRWADGNVGLIFAANAENITIEGPGTIDGQGDNFAVRTAATPSPAGISGNRRPYHLLFYQCTESHGSRYVSEGLRVSFHARLQCSYVKLDGVHIHSRVVSNNDGFHFISSQYVT